MEKNIFYQKMNRVFQSSEFEDFKNSYCNDMNLETANMFFIYNFLLLTHSQALNQPLTPEESINIVHQWIKNSDIRKRLIEHWKDTGLSGSDLMIKKLSLLDKIKKKIESKKTD